MSEEYAETGPGSSVSGLSPVPEGDRTPGERVGDLRAHLAAVVHAAGCQCAGAPTGLTLRTLDVDLIADAVLHAGYRLVVDDDTTVERVARAIHHVGCGSDDLCKGYDHHGDWDRRIRDDSYEAEARAAISALRDGSNQ